MKSIPPSIALPACIALTCLTASACIGPSMTTINEPEVGRTGSLQVTTSTSGTNLDPDGYLVSLDEQRSQTVDINGGAFFSDLRIGQWQVDIDDVAGSCGLTNGPAPRGISVIENEVAEVAFILECS